ncbi:translesion error-prone DNA polymerase V autoproteolytic subunit [Flavobacterium silvisoli]|uniref:Translesion error-prone DNA polymerase V autoproteolytic subunit n=1 Tax=Flavobacterium silvisoli TaxID=2529433 RepID=A0A4Q9Z4U4_9FLAO|nr:translesion error-prone DNA polymerase V autoproteolytic subunit [Flavobacterium silvisoli]TBX71322.1 translesion error-prone DNA polymerase V autoproteolytic subunit [Flavobacterium silvisoli]
MSLKKKLTFFIPDSENPQELPYFDSGIKAGFPSPAADFDETKISLDRVLVKNTEATFYAKADGTSMSGAGIDDGDIMIIDRSLEPADGRIAVCCIDGEFTVKRLAIKEDGLYLLPENPSFQPIKVEENHKLIIWGIVTYVIKSV